VAPACKRSGLASKLYVNSEQCHLDNRLKDLWEREIKTSESGAAYLKPGKTSLGLVIETGSVRRNKRKQEQQGTRHKT
jgi:hypothetical protein